MLSIDNTKRWYDQNPTLSLAISILRNASYESQMQVSSYLLQKVADIEVLKAQSHKFSIFNRRWYDYDENLFLAVEFIRLSTPEVQNDLAIEIINYLCNLDMSVSK